MENIYEVEFIDRHNTLQKKEILAKNIIHAINVAHYPDRDIRSVKYSRTQLHTH